METFRDHLYKAQVCKCKLDKFKRIQNELLLANKKNETILEDCTNKQSESLDEEIVEKQNLEEAKDDTVNEKQQTVFEQSSNNQEQQTENGDHAKENVRTVLK